MYGTTDSNLFCIFYLIKSLVKVYVNLTLDQRVK